MHATTRSLNALLLFHPGDKNTRGPSTTAEAHSMHTQTDKAQTDRARADRVRTDRAWTDRAQTDIARTDRHDQNTTQGAGLLTFRPLGSR
jgi:hypothetical protein